MNPVWTDPITIGFGLGSAAAFGLAALFSTRGNRLVCGFMVFMWLATKVWDHKTGSDAQIYMDTILATLCGLVCGAVALRERRALWPIVILGLMAAWVVLIAAYADPGRAYGPQVKWMFQLASNVIFGMALFVGAVPGGRRGALAFRRWVSRHPFMRASAAVTSGSRPRKVEGR